MNIQFGIKLLELALFFIFFQEKTKKDIPMHKILYIHVRFEKKSYSIKYDAK